MLKTVCKSQALPMAVKFVFEQTVSQYYFIAREAQNEQLAKNNRCQNFSYPRNDIRGSTDWGNNVHRIPFDLPGFPVSNHNRFPWCNVHPQYCQ
jgi:hypothetical protein